MKHKLWSAKHSLFCSLSSIWSWHFSAFVDEDESLINFLALLPRFVLFCDGLVYVHWIQRDDFLSVVCHRWRPRTDSDLLWAWDSTFLIIRLSQSPKKSFLFFFKHLQSCIFVTKLTLFDVKWCTSFSMPLFSRSLFFSCPRGFFVSSLDCLGSRGNQI